MSAGKVTISQPSSAASPSRLARRLMQLACLGLAGFLIFAFFGGTRTAFYGPPPEAPKPTNDSITPPNTAAPLDEPLRLLADARAAFDAVHDYTCVLITQERVKGQLTPEKVMTLKVRHRPFSVYMLMREPKDLAGQEVCYVAGKNDDKMRVHPNGALRLLGWVTIDQKDPRARKTSRHAISEAGLGNLIARYTKAWERERSAGRTRVTIAPYEYNKRPCTRVETCHVGSAPGDFEYYRTVVYFDKELKFPVRVECYAYPRDADDPGDLLEVFSYVDLHCNVGLGDETFNH